ncbi:MAG: adenosylcobinamide-phosphate synthase CbiB [Planctomycetota bacterium]|jgi:adenosylcobinamide-phosphate synthase|nr:adenosylcobinamide-phosphate synthase CbiB [Planctomycetota bacterium]
MCDCAAILIAAFVLDLLFGDPVYRLHPVRCIGYLAHFLEGRLRRMHLSGLVGGCLLAALSLGVTLAVALGSSAVLHRLGIWPVWAWHVYLTTSCIALRDLIDHARPVADALRAGDLPRARDAVQRIVGRDASRLDETGVARATVETVAENFVDGFLGPVFWYVAGAIALRNVNPAAGALAALVGYRVTNTLDSMVGYRNEKYLLFGRAAARLDDALNFIPARLSIPILSLGAAVCGHDARNAFRIALRDRNKHVSPNSGHPESCMAGALSIRLGGPTIYPHGTVEKLWLGDGDSKVTPAHIDSCCRIVFIGGCMAWILALLLMDGTAR